MISIEFKREINRIWARGLNKGFYYINMLFKTSISTHGHNGSYDKVILYDTDQGALVNFSIFDLCECDGCKNNFYKLRRWRLKSKS
jgi:hypothetical protein